MAELEEKLNEILGNQQAMGQIMALARSLSGGGVVPEEVEEPPNGMEEIPVSEGRGLSSTVPDLTLLLGQVDPAMVQMGMRLVQEYQGREDRNTALLSALRPFLREERRAKLDRAMELVRVTRLIRVALSAMGEKGADGDV